MDMTKIEVLSGLVLITEGCYSIGIFVFEKTWSWDHWIRHGKFGWNQIPYEEMKI
jgi:hypothetical protein